MNKQNSRVLIVDDEQEICKYLSVLIQKEGFAALVAYDGHAALKMVASETPDVMLSDIRMPGMDGMELLKESKKLGPDMPVIMITGYAGIHGAVEAMRAGAHDYLAKQFLEATNLDLGKNVQGLSESAINALLSFDWPGNVRQLRSIIRRAVLLADDMITEEHLDMDGVPAPSVTLPPKIQDMPWEDLSLKQIMRRSNLAVEREVLTKVLQYTGGNKARAARLLKIDYKTIHAKIKQLGIPIGGTYG